MCIIYTLSGCGCEIVLFLLKIIAHPVFKRVKKVYLEDRRKYVSDMFELTDQKFAFR